jgi:hypothetical protein
VKKQRSIPRIEVDAEGLKSFDGGIMLQVSSHKAHFQFG